MARGRSSRRTAPCVVSTAAQAGNCPELRQESQRTFINADGTRTTEFSRDPLNFRRPDGTWQPIDTRLVPGWQGWRNAADSVQVWTAGQTGSGTGGAAGASAAVAGSSSGWRRPRHPPARWTAAPSPTPEVRPGADLRLEVTSRGLKETIALKSPDAPAEWVFPLSTTGLQPSLVDGEVVFRDENGVERARIPRGFMVDSAYDERTGEYATSYGVSYELVEGGLRMRLDEAWLRDPHRVYPVTVDPPVDVRPAAASMYVQRNSDGSSFSRTDELRVGHATDAAAVPPPRATSRSPVSRTPCATTRSSVRSSRCTNYHSWSCKARPVTVHPVTQSWTRRHWAPLPGARLRCRARRVRASRTVTSRGGRRPRHVRPRARPSRSATPAGISCSVGSTASRRTTGSPCALPRPMCSGGRSSPAGTANPPRLAVTYTPFDADVRVREPGAEPAGDQDPGRQGQDQGHQPGRGHLDRGRLRAGVPDLRPQRRLSGLDEAAALPSDVARGGRSRSTR